MTQRPYGKTSMKIATSHNICPQGMTAPELISRLAEAGFHAVDFNYCDLLDHLDWFDERADEPCWKGT